MSKNNHDVLYIISDLYSMYTGVTVGVAEDLTEVVVRSRIDLGPLTFTWLGKIEAAVGLPLESFCRNHVYRRVETTGSVGEEYSDWTEDHVYTHNFYFKSKDTIDDQTKES